MYKIVKRNGMQVSFNAKKISEVIKKAFVGTNTNFDDDIISLLTLRTCADINGKVVNNLLHVEAIQDSVEKVMSEAGYAEVAKAFILYRKQRETARNFIKDQDIYSGIISKYLNSKKYNVDTSLTSIGDLILFNSATITSNYWLNEIYEHEIVSAHNEGKIHLHGLDMLAPLSAGWDAYILAKRGILGIKDNAVWTASETALDFCLQTVNFLGLMQNEFAQAQSFSHFDTILAGYVHHENLEYEQVLKLLKEFIASLNTPSRWGSQANFIQLNFDWHCPLSLSNRKVLIAGKECSYLYGDLEKEIALINKAFLTIMLHGGCDGKAYKYPLPAYNLSSFTWQEDNLALLFKLAIKYGSPLLVSEDNKDYLTSEKIDYSHLYFDGGGYFGHLSNQGSLGAVSINLAQIAYKSLNEEHFKQQLNDLLTIAGKALWRKKETLEVLFERGLFPFTKQYLNDYSHYFLTISLVGANEASLNAQWLRQDLSGEQAQDFILSILKFMKDKCLALQKQYKCLFNLAPLPAEKASYRLAKLDSQKYPDIISASSDKNYPYYSNSSFLPVDFKGDLFVSLAIQDKLQASYNASSVFPIYLAEKNVDYASAIALVQKISKYYHLNAVTLSPIYSICKKHGYLKGMHKLCPFCQRECAIYTRFSGYYKNLKEENLGKQKQFIDWYNFVQNNKITTNN